MHHPSFPFEFEGSILGTCPPRSFSLHLIWIYECCARIHFNLFLGSSQVFLPRLGTTSRLKRKCHQNRQDLAHHQRTYQNDTLHYIKWCREQNKEWKRLKNDQKYIFNSLVRDSGGSGQQLRLLLQLAYNGEARCISQEKLCRLLDWRQRFQRPSSCIVIKLGRVA